MRVDLMPRRLDFVEAHRFQSYRTFRCSGSCSTEIVALAGAALWCGQPGCRGSMKPSYPVSSKRLANEQFEAARDRGETSRSTPTFKGFWPHRGPEWSKYDDDCIQWAGWQGWVILRSEKNFILLHTSYFILHTSYRSYLLLHTSLRRPGEGMKYEGMKYESCLTQPAWSWELVVAAGEILQPNTLFILHPLSPLLHPQ